MGDTLTALATVLLTVSCWLQGNYLLFTASSILFTVVVEHKYELCLRHGLYELHDFMPLLPILLVVFDLWQALRPLKKSPRTGWIIRLAFFIIFVDVMWFHLIAESHFGVNATTWWVERGHIILDAMGISCTIYATAFLASRSSMFSKRHLLGMPARDGSPQIPLLLASSDEAVIEAVQLQISGWGKCELKLVQSFKKLRMALKQTHFVAIFIDAELPGFDVAHISDLTPLLGIASSGTTNPTMVYIIADKSIIPSHAQLGTSKVRDFIEKPIASIQLDAILMDINVGSGDDDFDEVSDDHSVCNDPSSSSTSAPDNVGIRPRRESGQGSMDASRSSNASLVAELERCKAELHALQRVFHSVIPPQYLHHISPKGAEMLQLGNVEKMEVNNVVDFLNSYYCFALPVIPRFRGFVDKFIGDSIMCVFAHDAPSQGAEDSVRCAIGMLAALDYMNTLPGFESYQCDTGIGINSGRCIMCVVGTEARMEPTVLGDDVNLASRTESLCKKYKARILITEQTRRLLGSKGDDLFLMRQVDFCTPVGKAKPVKIYEVIDADLEPTKTKKATLLTEWVRALSLFNQRKVQLAKQAFETCLSIYTEDQPSQIWIERCQRYLNDPKWKSDVEDPAALWPPAFSMDTK